jgi:predicted phosphoribosyltransferase
MRGFRDRVDAGRRLAEKLSEFAGRSDVLVLALPRGGVPVGAEVARRLGAPLDVLVVRKLGLPGNEEYAMGAIGSGGVEVLNPDVINRWGLRPRDVETIVRRETAELRRREKAYRGDRDFPDLRGKTVLIVDDGVATGATMRAAVAVVASAKPAATLVAVPTIAAETAKELEECADAVIALIRSEDFGSVGQWYDDFSQTSDDEVIRLLAASGPDNPLASHNR